MSKRCVDALDAAVEPLDSLLVPLATLEVDGVGEGALSRQASRCGAAGVRVDHALRAELIVVQPDSLSSSPFVSASLFPR